MSNDKNLVKIKEGVYLSKNDDKFFEKYLEEFPEVKSAFDDNKLDNNILNNNILDSAEISSKEIKKEKNNKSLISKILVILIFLLVGSFLYHLYINPIQPYNKIILSNKENINNPAVIEKDIKESLPMIVVLNAVTHYKQKNNQLPDNINQLISAYPDNWISFIPKGVLYENVNNNFKISNNGELLPCPCIPDELTLYFYEATNQLGLKYGDQLLALYPVASGKEKLPFAETFVTERVVNPNGGNGALGTRGLVLEDSYAIHGTNAPELIGKDVSHGCIRMKNEDIEVLFPYISKGTKLKVVQQKPEKPLFSNGLPLLVPSNSDNNPNLIKEMYKKEENNKAIYHWKN